MSRSQSVREEALRLDGYRCQVTGFDGRSEEGRKQLEVHHVQPLGMGGSDELDTVENCITLHAPIHVNVESGALTIARWSRGGIEIKPGLLRGCEFEIVDNHNVLGHGVGRVDHQHLWFYRRHDAEELEKVESCIQGVHKADGNVAYALWRLWKNDSFKALDPDARSFKEYCEGRDWRTTSCVEMAETYELSQEEKFDWLPEETMRAFKARARTKGLIGKREYHYVKIPAKSWLTGARPEVYYRTAYEQELRDKMEIGSRLYKIGKTVWGLRAEGGKLFDPNGNEVDVVHFVPEEA